MDCGCAMPMPFSRVIRVSMLALFSPNHCVYRWTMKHILIVAAIWLSAPWNPISGQNVGGGNPTASDEGVERDRDLSVVTSRNRGEERLSVFAPPQLSQVEVLQELYSSTNGNMWTDSSNWVESGVVSDEDLCDGEWKGVTCDDAKKITKLELVDNNLDGTIPLELGQLSNLIELDLRRNELD
eukprot:scaffold25440_cov31-Attheya_sp.AAC.1